MSEGRCVYGCILGAAVCSHLDAYLNMTGVREEEQLPEFLTGDIEDLPDERRPESPSVTGVWDFFKDMRAYGLKNHQILVLIDRLIMGKTYRQMAEDRGWTSVGTTHRVYRNAIKQLKARGYGGWEK